MDKTRPVIILKKKARHAGHHGGAWKVAYADFVTAMMSLFIVLWLLNSSKPIQDAVGGYFRDPNGTAAKKALWPAPLKNSSSPKTTCPS
jgi:chemotaxis protein MotB